MLNIPSNIHGYELHRYLYPLQIDTNKDFQDARLLYRIVSSSLVKDWIIGKQIFIEKLNLKEEDIQRLSSGQYGNSENLEIKARCMDIMRTKSDNY